MNRHLHRVVFNAARGVRMVVQETAASTGKGASRATAVSAMTVAGLLLAAAAQAQIVGAPNVPGNLRPTVLVVPNGVPLVNIQTPSAAGVSRNVYNQLNVGANGAILNNSRTNVQTQLGGFVQGNPFLAGGPARIILNEVNGGSPSQLRGYIEVGGQRAEVIIANPAGISVDGGQAVLQFGGRSQIGTFVEGNIYRVLELQVGMYISPADFAARAPNSISVDVARKALADMGMPLPVSLSTRADRNYFLAAAPRMTPEQIAEFLSRVK
ncbi:filamentous hemagglutinin N-terminal domain-containing protein [Variovorax sp. H27-G14]